MNVFIIVIYCFIDYYLQIAGEKSAAGRKLNDARVAVCLNACINRCSLLQIKVYRGYNASKKEYFYGS